MMKIIYGHSPHNFKTLKIAGDFSDWEPLSMVKNHKDGLWEYVIDPGKLPPNTRKVHFKFIDDNGTWFTDEDYPKEVDEHSNENNVKLLTGKDEVEEAEVDFEGPESPVPSLKAPSEKKSVAVAKKPSNQIADDKYESVGGSAVLVNHSDAEDERQIVDNSQRPETVGTAVSGRESDPEQYKDVLARIIAFFTDLFRSWFG